jgi:hypothetical protein
VSLALQGLQPGTTYYYRLVASSTDGMVPGELASFTTPGFPTLIAPPASPPLIAVPNIAFPKEEAGSTGTTTTKTLTNKQKLAKALKVCKRRFGAHPPKKRSGCEAAAHKKYPTASKKKTKKK